MRLIRELWNDESGLILSAEAVTVGTVGVLGSIVGLNAVGNSLNDEMREMAGAFRSLDQSYAYSGQRSSRAWTAGSCYIQPDVQQSLAEISENGPATVREVQDRIEADRKARSPKSGDLPKIDPKTEPLPNQIPVPQQKNVDEPKPVGPTT